MTISRTRNYSQILKKFVTSPNYKVCGNSPAKCEFGYKERRNSQLL